LAIFFLEKTSPQLRSKIAQRNATLRPMSTELKRSLTLFGLVMIAVGSSIGSGVFRAPGRIAEQVHLPEYVIGLWVLGGFVALCGALTYAEMGSMFPGAGGLYVYLREAYGDLTGFLYGWFILFVSTSGAIAALSVVCAEHLLFLVGQPPNGSLTVPLAVGIIAFLTLFNSFGVQLGGRLALVFTLAKLAGLVLIIGVGWLLANPSAIAANQTSVFANTPPAEPWRAFSTALVGILFSYGGWQHAAFMSAETHHPQRTVPRAMIIGAIIVTTVYVLANVAYMRLLPLEHVAGTATVAADALGTRFAWGGPLMAFLIALSTFGTIGIYCMTAPRIYYAMARDGVFFEQLARIHPRWQTPINAMSLQAAWSIVLVLVWGTFGDLIDYATFIDWIGLGMVASAIFVFRKKMPDAPRGYRTLLYPLPPLIFIGVTAVFVALRLANSPIKSGAGLAVIGVGWVVYHLFFKKKK
jgi:basic amino acid/polyamine antiporter, APA family